MDGKALKAARKRAGLYQADVARELGVEQSTISRWERGTPVPLEKVTALAELLGMRPEEISPEIAPKPSRPRFVSSFEELNEWRTRVLREEEDPDFRLLLVAIPVFLDEVSWIVPVTVEQITELLGGEDLVAQNWERALSSPWVERVGQVKYTLRLRFPE